MDKKSLMTIVPKYFAMKKFRSFVRQLSGWGFRRIRRQGADYGCYYHECFLRGIPLLTWLMRRTRPNEGNPTIVVQSIEEEPNFYDMRHLHPLPLPPPLCHSSMRPDVVTKSAEVVGNYLSAKEYGLSRRASAPTFSASSSLADSKSCPTALLRLHSYEQRDFVQHHHLVPRVLAEEFIPKRAPTTSSVPLSVSHPHSTFSDFIESNSALPSDQGFSPQSSMVEGMRMRQREIYQSSSYRIENEIGAQNNKYIGTEPNTQLPSGKGSPLVYCSSVAAEAAAAAALSSPTFQNPTFQNLLQPTRTFNVRCPFDYERKLSFSEKHYAMTSSASVYQTNRFSETQFPTAKTSAQEDQTIMQFCQICDTEPVDSQNL